MILYSFVNMYYCGILAGIQVQHSTTRLMRKYENGSTEHDMVWKWATEVEVSRVLRGPDHNGMLQLLEDLKKARLPVAEFYDAGNNNSLSSISVVIPQNLCDIMKEIRENNLSLIDILRISDMNGEDLYGAEHLLKYIATRPTCS